MSTLSEKLGKAENKIKEQLEEVATNAITDAEEKAGKKAQKISTSYTIRSSVNNIIKLHELGLLEEEEHGKLNEIFQNVTTRWVLSGMK